MLCNHLIFSLLNCKSSLRKGRVFSGIFAARRVISRRVISTEEYNSERAGVSESVTGVLRMFILCGIPRGSKVSINSS